MSPGATAEVATGLESYQSSGSQKVNDAKLQLAPSTCTVPYCRECPSKPASSEGLLSEAHSCLSLCGDKRVAEPTEVGNLEELAQKMV